MQVPMSKTPGNFCWKLIEAPNDSILFLSDIHTEKPHMPSENQSSSAWKASLKQLIPSAANPSADGLLWHV